MSRSDLVPSSMGIRPLQSGAVHLVPADEAMLKLVHVKTCQCKYVPAHDAAKQTFEEVKLIDTRCIAAYVVPDSRQRGPKADTPPVTNSKETNA